MVRALRRRVFSAAFLLLWLLLTQSLLPWAAEPSSESGDSLPLFREWQVWEVKSGKPIPFEQLAPDLAAVDVIYLGEEHHNRWHIEAALLVLRSLLDRGRRPILAVEMFGWDGQEALDRYLADPSEARDRFLRESLWEQNWGGAFEDYEPLVRLAREQRLAVLALNPPKSLVRKVAMQGLSRAKDDPEMARWGMKEEVLVEEPAYREIIVNQLRLCHGGMADDAYERMYEASVFRDEGMAKTIADRLKAAGAAQQTEPLGPIVSYTGSGHIQYRLPVPDRVSRRAESVRQVTIYLSSYDPSRAEEIRSLLKDSVADYVWLTPMSPHGPPRRCR
ncbi:MAG: ChaN family lipoprotein [Nitrospirota bacterium]